MSSSRTADQIDGRRHRMPPTIAGLLLAHVGLADVFPEFTRPARGPKAEPVTPRDKTGRNDPCPCGSGRKFKHCHG